MVHLDKCAHPNSTQAFQHLQKPSETLLDEKKKSEYLKILKSVNNSDSFSQKQIKTIERVLQCNNYYEILEVDIEATELEIEIKFEELKRLIHPDKCEAQNSELAFERV
jgi:DnaJ-class molecular chaperone